MSVVVWISIRNARCLLLFYPIGRFPCLAISLLRTCDGIRYG
jgi:hypothetical protein